MIGNIYNNPELLDTVELSEEYTEGEGDEEAVTTAGIQVIGHTVVGYSERWDGAIERWDGVIERFDGVIAREYVSGEEMQEDEENEDE